MRISDWSSDVCSSDLACPPHRRYKYSSRPARRPVQHANPSLGLLICAAARDRKSTGSHHLRRHPWRAPARLREPYARPAQTPPPVTARPSSPPPGTSPPPPSPPCSRHPPHAPHHASP